MTPTEQSRRTRHRPSGLTRRAFLKSSTAAFAAPWIVPARCFGANERVTVGMVGVGQQGIITTQQFLDAGCNVAAVCDVDREHIAGAVNAVTNAGHPSPAAEEDFRRLLERRDIDAVVNTTPDHWHALVAIHACRAGKDVYTEKPLAYCIAEGRRMVQAAREHRRIVQTGSQQRSMEEFWKAAMLVRNGRLGPVQEATVFLPKFKPLKKVAAATTPPPHLNWELWLGPAPEHAYSPDRCHYKWHYWWDYSGGQIHNWGTHHLDIVHWALGLDETGPVNVTGTATFHPGQLYEIPDTCRLVLTYPGGLSVTAQLNHPGPERGILFRGTEGTLFVDRGKLDVDPPERANLRFEDLPVQLTRSTNHVTNFLESLRSRALPICDVEIGHRTASACLLGKIVTRTGREVNWDPQTEQILGDEEASRYLDREYRSPWSRT